MSESDQVIRRFDKVDASIEKLAETTNVSVGKLADATSQLAKTMVRAEERHRHTDDTLARFGQVLEEHTRQITANAIAIAVMLESNKPGAVLKDKLATAIISIICAAIASVVLIK